MRKLWYVAYGSNLLPTNVARYLGSDAEYMLDTSSASQTPDAHFIHVTSLFHLPYERYFAGESARWDGGVAFLSLYRSFKGCRGRGYLVTEDQFDQLFCGENRVTGMSVAEDVWTLEPGNRHVHDMPEFAENPCVGKYNAVLRLDDTNGVPAATITTARVLPRRAPEDTYLRAIKAGERIS